MLRAWRERDQEKRIKTAHQAVEHNPKYVLLTPTVFEFIEISRVHVYNMTLYLIALMHIYVSLTVANYTHQAFLPKSKPVTFSEK